MKIFSSTLDGMFQDVDVSLGSEFVLLYFDVLDILRKCYIWLNSNSESNEKRPAQYQDTLESIDASLQKIIAESDYVGKVSRMYDVVTSDDWSDMMLHMKSKLSLK